MGVFDAIEARRETSNAPDPAAAESNQPKHEESDVYGDTTDTSNTTSERSSLEARNEKEIQQHPDQVTEDAQLGVKKAEAVALIWSKKTVYAIYAW